MQKFDSNAQRTDSRSDSFAGHSEDTVTTNHNLYRILNSNSNQADDERKVKEDPSSVAIAIDVDPEDDQSTDEYASMPLAPSNDSHRRNSKGTRQSDGRRSSAKEEDSAFLIICQQRDRFRNKAKDLESAKLRLESRMNRLSAENATLKKENVELYSKMKFLESYNVAKRNFTPQSTLSNRKGVKAEEIEMKYENLYEMEMNPFNQFRKRQMEHRINNLPWTEWIAFMVGSTVMSKRVFRAFAVFYSFLLHLLVFFTLFHEYRTHHIFDHHSNELEQPLPVIFGDVADDDAIDPQ